MKNNLKFALTAISLAFGTLYSYAQQVDSSAFYKIQEIQQHAKSQFAPDKRTKILAFKNADAKQNIYQIETTEASAKNYITAALQAANIPAQVSIQLLPDASVGAKTVGVVTLSVANLRTQPEHSAEMATQVILGTTVDILQRENGFFRVRTPEGYISWVNTHSITAMTAAELTAWKAAPKVMYTQAYGNSFSENSTKSQSVSDLVYGNLLLLKGTKGAFYEVQYPDQRIAFIPKKEAQPFDTWIASRQLTAEGILSAAKTMMGLPYLWGGTSVKGVDCSGFTKTSFFMNGVIIPRDASQQVLQGDQIDILDSEGNFDAEKALKNLKPADLLFFAAGKSKSKNARVTHVALYLGEGQFIHSAGSVRVNSMLKEAKNYDDFQTRTVVAARRYIGAHDSQIQPVKENSYYANNN